MSSSLLIHSSVSSNLLLIPSNIYFILVIVIISSIWFFFMFSNSLSDFILCSFFLWVHWASSWSLPWTLYRQVVYHHFVYFLFLVFVLFFFWRIFICFLILPNSLYISMYWVDQLHFPVLEKWPYVVDIPWGPAAHSPLFTSAICSRGAPCVGWVGHLLCWGQSRWVRWKAEPTPGPSGC